jgi:hypothetical protein
MTIDGIRRYGTASRELITFTFTRSRPNLDVRLQIDGGAFQPVLASFSFVAPPQRGDVRRVVVMATGVNGDTCQVDISGETGAADTDLLSIVDPVPVASARYTFTVA